MEALAVGVMSGTSLDGVSTALVKLRDEPPDPPRAELIAFRQEPYSAAERGAIIDGIARGTPKDLAFLHVALGERFAGAVLSLLAQARLTPRDLTFVASHGQTIWHEPGRATLPASGRPDVGWVPMRFRYSRWDGSQDPFGPDVAAGDLLDIAARDDPRPPQLGQPDPDVGRDGRVGIDARGVVDPHRRLVRARLQIDLAHRHADVAMALAGHMDLARGRE